MAPRHWNLPGLAHMLAVGVLAALLLAACLLFSLLISQRVSAQSGTRHRVQVPAQHQALHLDLATGALAEPTPAALFHPIIVDLGAGCSMHSIAFAINAEGVVAGYCDYHAVLWQNTYGINDLGQVIGASITADGHSRAFFWDRGLMRELPSLGGPPAEGNCRASAINAGGMVAGECYTPTRPHAVLWDLWDNTSLFLPAIKRGAPERELVRQ